MGPAVYRGKDTTLKTLETMCNARAWLAKNVGKTQHATSNNVGSRGPTMLGPFARR